MSILEGIYSAAMAALSPALALVPRKGKVGTGAAGMRMALAGFQRWAVSHRDVARELVWFHAPSVGEGFQAQAVMRSLRALRPDLQIAYTFFSPSALDFARSAPADVAGFLPPDTRANARGMLDALRPAAVVFVKTEIWPGLVRECSERGIPTLLLSATLPAGSSRLRGPGRRLLMKSHARLARVGAIAEEDAERFAQLGVDTEHRTVAGDARFDQAFQRAGHPGYGKPQLSRPLLIAGSTWPADEAVLLEALGKLDAAGKRPHAMLVPHEPSPSAVAALKAEIEARGLGAALWSKVAGAGGLQAAASRLEAGDILIVDRIGILGSLYGSADLAWVGGGFGSSGLHSVLEPAAWGLAVLFGPRHGNAREAAELIQAGGAFTVNNADDLAVRVNELIETPGALTQAGSSALDYVRSHLGAAERGAHLILQEMDRAAVSGTE